MGPSGVTPCHRHLCPWTRVALHNRRLPTHDDDVELSSGQKQNHIFFVFFEVFVLLFNCFQVSKLNFFLTFERHQTSIFFPPGSGSIPLFSTIVPTLPYCSSIDTDRLAFWTPSSSRAQLYEGSRRLSVSWPRDTKDCSNPDNYI